jgi:tetratricopeptide (TPR) repeat protein
MNYCKVTSLIIFVLLIASAVSTQAAPVSTQAAPASFASLPVIDPEEAKQENNSVDYAKQGDINLHRLDWRGAQQEYQEALRLWSGNMNALYGLAKCSQAAGDPAKALDYYRKAVYPANPADKDFKENDTTRLMEFALLLNKAGQTAEAILVYNHAAYALDYQDSQFRNGEPSLKVLLPEIVVERVSPDQVRYTPEHLQALAETALAHQNHDAKEERAQMDAAVKLYPDSPVTHYYQGEVLFRANDPDAKAAYQKATELGDDKVSEAAKERLKVLH